MISYIKGPNPPPGGWDGHRNGSRPSPLRPPLGRSAGQTKSFGRATAPGPVAEPGSFGRGVPDVRVFVAQMGGERIGGFGISDDSERLAEFQANLRIRMI